MQTHDAPGLMSFRGQVVHALTGFAIITLTVVSSWFTFLMQESDSQSCPCCWYVDEKA